MQSGKLASFYLPLHCACVGWCVVWAMLAGSRVVDGGPVAAARGPTPVSNGTINVNIEYHFSIATSD